MTELKSCRYTKKHIRTTGTNDGYLLRCCDHHWSDEHESITVRSDEAAIPVDVGGSMIGSVKKEPMQFVTITCLSIVSNYGSVEQR